AGADGTNGLSPTPGGAGGTAGALDYTVNFGSFDISTSAVILFGVLQLVPPDEGISVRSTGGRGGDGGDSTDVAAQGRGGGRGGNGGTGGDAGGVTGFGGDGGLGGNGGSVTVDANNFITTTGAGAVGIFAQ